MDAKKTEMNSSWMCTTNSRTRGTKQQTSWNSGNPFFVFPIFFNNSGQILEQSCRDVKESPYLKVFKTELNNFSEQPDLIRCAISKGLEKMGTSGGPF